MRRSSQNKRTRQAKTGISQSIADAISSSRWILNLNDDWDEKGSPGYEQTTWQRACDFLVRQAKFARESHKRNLPAPRILPGPDGSIDVHWKMPQFELLVNIPEDPSKLCETSVEIRHVVEHPVSRYTVELSVVERERLHICNAAVDSLRSSELHHPRRQVDSDNLGIDLLGEPRS